MAPSSTSWWTMKVTTSRCPRSVVRLLEIRRGRRSPATIGRLAKGGPNWFSGTSRRPRRLIQEQIQGRRLTAMVDIAAYRGDEHPSAFARRRLRAAAGQPSPCGESLAGRLLACPAEALLRLETARLRRFAASAGQPSPAIKSEGWRPQRDSNPCLGLERATSWASGRWGRSEKCPESLMITRAVSPPRGWLWLLSSGCHHPCAPTEHGRSPPHWPTAGLAQTSAGSEAPRDLARP